MTLPAITLGFILATLYAAVFHLAAGGDARRLAVYLIASWVGFAFGQVIGTVLGIGLFDIGTLRLLTATVMAVFALIGALWLMRRRQMFV